MRKTLEQQLEEYFAGKRHKFDVKVKLSGTPFQILVWNALKRIPYGQTRSYKQIATMIKRPNAVRAVGTACRKNPLPIVIPCHRVVGSGGKFGGYAGGLAAKRWLLNLEQMHKM